MSNTNFAEEFDTEMMTAAEDLAAELDMPAEAVAAEGTAPARETYQLADGSVGSRAAYIRELFLMQNMSRKEISEKYNFPYRVVYSATVNMTNEAEAGTSRGRGAISSVVKVTKEGNKLVEVKAIDGVDCVFMDGEATGYAIEEDKIIDTMTNDLIDTVIDKNRNTWINERVNQGTSRGDIAKMLDVSYGVVYAATKDIEGSRVKHDIKLDNGETISRAEYIRRLFAEGKSRGDIAKMLEVPYSVVWQATKTEKTAQEQFKELLEKFGEFKEKVTNQELFDDILAAMQALEIKEETADKTEVDADAEMPAAE